jgi:hypothetical protein
MPYEACMDEEGRAKLEAMNVDLAAVRRRIAALERIAEKAKKSSQCAIVMAILAVFVVVIVAVVVFLLADNCAALGC